jgi:hypothetical protein
MVHSDAAGNKVVEHLDSLIFDSCLTKQLLRRRALCMGEVTLCIRYARERHNTTRTESHVYQIPASLGLDLPGNKSPKML